MDYTLFGLLRHGKTEWNEEGRIQGSGDSPLTTEGVEEIEQWGQFLLNFKWDRIISSPLGRTRQTSEIINNHLNIPLEFHNGLREQHWGDWEGVTKKIIHDEHTVELNRQVSLGWNFRPPNGESRKEVLSRVQESLLTIAKKYPTEKILIICHQGVIRSTVYHLSDRQFLPEEPKILSKRTLHLIAANKGTLTIDKLNISKNEIS